MRAREEDDYRYFHTIQGIIFRCSISALSFVNCDSKIILEKVYVDSPKTTGHFSENDGSLFIKRRVTFHKTTGRFS